MKFFLLFALSFLLFSSCDQNQKDIKKIKALENRIASLERQLQEVYKPGFGEMMSEIQVHHSKLWFAGKNQNWKLANFEIKELYEIMEDIEKYQKEREETKLMNMIEPGLERVKKAIEKQNLNDFTQSYNFLTKSCNDCHVSTNFGYNVVKTPVIAPIGNQKYKLN
jgi:hypothetical protein